jgi:hypothetical protein
LCSLLSPFDHKTKQERIIELEMTRVNKTMQGVGCKMPMIQPIHFECNGMVQTCKALSEDIITRKNLGIFYTKLFSMLANSITINKENSL